MTIAAYAVAEGALAAQPLTVPSVVARPPKARRTLATADAVATPEAR